MSQNKLSDENWDMHAERYRQALTRHPCPFCAGSGDLKQVKAAIILAIVEEWLARALAKVSP